MCDVYQLFVDIYLVHTLIFKVILGIIVLTLEKLKFLT